ncbi:MAG: sulfatase-like hydrolase/transferase, partial [Kiritimatiellae bacterium]|nr:sulfatase-like hydrolase/transferase [Kiritimatiellia bacterium]
MRAKRGLTGCFCCAVLMVMSLWGAQPKGVILVLIDDIGYGDINALEPSDLKTPQLDQLHSESVRFTDFHVGTTCAPTRGSLMTGRAVNAGGVFHTIACRDRLFQGEQTMAEVFKANQWATGIFGKWHLGNGYPYAPHYRGFDLAVIHRAGGVGQQPDYWGNDYYAKTRYDGSPATADRYLENGREVVSDEFCTDYWFKRAKAFIKTASQKEQRFFCYIPTNAAHSPFNAPPGGKPGF